MIIAGLWRYGDWRHVATGCNALVLSPVMLLQQFLTFLANVNSRSRSLYAIARPSVVCRLWSVCLSSVTFVRLTQAVHIFGTISTPLGAVAIH